MELTMLTIISAYGTFHGMGMIAAVTPKTCSGESILRAKVTSLDVAIVADSLPQRRKSWNVSSDLPKAIRSKGSG